MVGGAVGVREEQGIERTRFLKQAGVDIIVIDTAHGHSKNVIDTLKKLKKYILIYQLWLVILPPLMQQKI